MWKYRINTRTLTGRVSRKKRGPLTLSPPYLDEISVLNEECIRGPILSEKGDLTPVSSSFYSRDTCRRLGVVDPEFDVIRPRNLCLTSHASGEQQADPSLLFLLRNVRSKLQRELFFQGSQDAYTEGRDVRILVRVAPWMLQLPLHDTDQRTL